MTESEDVDCCNKSNNIEGAMKCDCHSCDAIVDNIRDEVSRKHIKILNKPDFADSIPEIEHIQQFIHCNKCIEELPDNTSPQEWARHEVGWTIWGFQVWCVRHNLNVLHVDFQGAKHPSSMERLPETEEEKKMVDYEWKKKNR